MLKKKILHLITGLEIGGAEMMLQKTLPRMQGDFDNRVCCIMGHGPIGEKLESAGVPVYYLNLRNIFDLNVIFRFKKIIHDFQPDLLITYLIHADLFGRVLGKIFGVKKIICSVRVKLIQWKYIPLLILDGLTSPLVTHYHFNSQTVALMYLKYFFLSKKKITVIPNGLEIEKYQIPVDRIAKCKEIGIPDNIPLIGCVGRLEKQKGHRYLLEAFETLLKNTSAFLILIGDGSDREQLEILSKKLGIENSMKFLGVRNDIPEILQIMNIFVLPSLYEGMSNALMEAMASGIPIIATDIPENRELIENEVNGMLVPTKNSKKLAVAFEKNINDTEKCMFISSAAKNTIIDRYSMDTISQKYIELINKI